MQRHNYLLSLLLSVLYFTSYAQTRDCDPVVLEGSAVPCMVGESPSSLVGFRYISGQWQQIPIQIDERMLTNIIDPYRAPNGPCIGKNEEEYLWEVYFYADPNTFTGLDPNPSFDNDDELAFMFRDAGEQAPNNDCPANVITNSRCEVEVLEPLSNNATLGYIYLFRQDGSLAQDAGMDYVDYDYDDFGGSYKDNYMVCYNGEADLNPEDSWIHTANYSMHFLRRWENDQLILKKGNMPNTDIIDSHQYFVSLNNCVKTEITFSQRRGPIIANIDGPIRGIRSVMGAHSGTFMELTLLMTECRSDNVFYYRIHPSAGYFEARDFNTNAIGMNFYSDRNTGPFVIDGNRDDDQFLSIEPSQWELVTGPQGSITSAYIYNTDVPLGTREEFDQGLADGIVEGYYKDRGAAETRKCSGDMASYGASGFHFRSRKCTDRLRKWSENPTCAPEFVNFFQGVRFNYFLPPQVTTSEAIKYAEFAKNPLTANTTVQNCLASAPTCTDGILNQDETGVDCGGATCPPCASVCTDVVVDNVNSTGTHVYEGYNSITSTAQIEPNSDITFLASSSITLQAGFHAKSNSVFRAAIQACSSSSQALETRSELEKWKVRLFPNPAQTEVQLNLSLHEKQEVEVVLYDLNGRQVRHLVSPEQLQHTIQMGTHDLAKGIYWVQIRTSDQMDMKKLVVQ
jgi:hypothetical protein